MNDKALDQGIAEKLRGLARTIDIVLNDDKKPRTVGFVLLGFQLSGDGKSQPCNYISNTDRDRVVALLREKLAELETPPVATRRT